MYWINKSSVNGAYIRLEPRSYADLSPHDKVVCLDVGQGRRLIVLSRTVD